MTKQIRVLIVDDSALIRQMLTRALAGDPRVEVVGVAKDGVEAIEKARDLAPDVVTLDVEMPEMNGLEAIPFIRKHSSARIIMLSSVDDSETTYRALAAGAVDFLSKPSAGMASSIPDLTELLLKKIRVAYRVDPTRVEAAEQMPAEPPVEVAPVLPDGDLAACVCIAASTGGPPALDRVFAGLLASLPAAYLVVQHLPEGFSASLAKRLDQMGPIRVTEARAGERIEPGHGYVAPHGTHLSVSVTSAGAPHVHLSRTSPVNGVRPSGDVLFESVAHVFGERAVGVVLTGMGADGARGCEAIRASGGATVVQDEATSVVWGMPRAAMRLGAAGRALPLNLIATEIRRLVRDRCGEACA